MIFRLPNPVLFHRILSVTADIYDIVFILGKIFEPPSTNSSLRNIFMYILNKFFNKKRDCLHYTLSLSSSSSPPSLDSSPISCRYICYQIKSNQIKSNQIKYIYSGENNIFILTEMKRTDVAESSYIYVSI